MVQNLHVGNYIPEVSKINLVIYQSNDQLSGKSKVLTFEIENLENLWLLNSLILEEGLY